MKTILDDPEDFFANGGWNFLATDSDVSKHLDLNSYVFPALRKIFINHFYRTKTKRKMRKARMLILLVKMKVVCSFSNVSFILAKSNSGTPS